MFGLFGETKIANWNAKIQSPFMYISIITSSQKYSTETHFKIVGH